MKKTLFLLVILLGVFLTSCTLSEMEDEEDRDNGRPYSPYPSSSNYDVSVNTILTWSDEYNGGIVYDIYFGKSYIPALVKRDSSIKYYDPGTLEYGTKYYWKVVAKDPYGGKIESRLWNFKTVEMSLVSWKDAKIETEYSISSDIIYITSSSYVHGTLELRDWDEDYGLEIMLMTEENFGKYREGYSFDAYHADVKGLRAYFYFENVPAGKYVMVIDNSHKGWIQPKTNRPVYFSFQSYIRKN